MILSGLTNTGNENKQLAAQPKVKAFLDMIARAEGANYNVMFGGRTFSDYSKHPNICVPFGKTCSTAAGRYQFLYKTWQGLSAKTGVSDFQPQSQDINAVQLLKDNGAINYILSGDIQTAINKVKKIWASFPGAGYGQGERKMSDLINWYNAALLSYGGSPQIKAPQFNAASFLPGGIDNNKLLVTLAAAAGVTIFVNLYRKF